MPPIDPFELLPCCLCGGTAQLKKNVRSGKWYVKCKGRKCGAKTEEASSSLLIGKVWNKRQKGQA